MSDFFQSVIIYFSRQRRIFRDDLSIHPLRFSFRAVNRQEFIDGNAEQAFVFLQIGLNKMPVRIAKLGILASV